MKHKDYFENLIAGIVIIFSNRPSIEYRLLGERLFFYHKIRIMRLIDRTIIDEFCKFREKGKYIRGIISWVGFQVPFKYKREARFAGKTKYPLKKLLKIATTVMLYFPKKPLKLFTNLGVLAVLIGIFYSIWIFAGKIFGFTNAISGWCSLIILIIFFGGVQLLTVGVLGQYIGILFDEIKDRPEYIIEKKENIT